MIDLHTLFMNNFEHRVFSTEPINTVVHNRRINLGWSVEKNGALLDLHALLTKNFKHRVLRIEPINTAVQRCASICRSTEIASR